MPAFQEIVNVVAYSLSILTFMSPIPSLVKAWKDRDLGDISLIPFAAMATNSFLWLAYAWLADDIFPLLTTFVCCETFSVAYVLVFMMLTPQKKRPMKILAVAASVVAVVALYIALARSGVTGQSRDSTATVVGVIADVGSFIMYSSPFETIVRIVRTKDASSMPIHLSLVGAIGNSVWVVYAALVMDVIVLVPNCICSTIGWVQVVVYVLYRPSKAAANRAKQLASPVVNMSAGMVESPSAAFSATATPSGRV